jgi:hypothetical protein
MHARATWDSAEVFRLAPAGLVIAVVGALGLAR